MQPSYALGAGELKPEAMQCHIWSSCTTPCLPTPPIQVDGGGGCKAVTQGRRGEEGGGKAEVRPSHEESEKSVVLFEVA